MIRIFNKRTSVIDTNIKEDADYFIDDVYITEYYIFGLLIYRRESSAKNTVISDDNKKDKQVGFKNK